MRTLFIMILLMVFFGFDHQSSNYSTRVAERFYYVDIDLTVLSYQEQIYLPIFSEYQSEIYKQGEYRAVVHVRNKSLTEDLYVLCANCYDTNGGLCDKIIKQTVKIGPDETRKIPINSTLNGLGPGANILLNWGMKKFDIRPEIYLELTFNSADSRFFYINEGKVISDQDEILDRRPL